MELQVAGSAVALLAPYLAEAGKAGAKKAGEAAWGKARQLVQLIQNKFAGQPYAEQTLERLKEKPDSPGRRTALTNLLAEEMETDSDFAASVTRIVRSITTRKTEVRQDVRGNQNITVGGDVSGSTLGIGDEAPRRPRRER